jgi:hypothetical protein
MKYSELFTLNPIESVIQIDKADKKNEAQLLVARFVITPSLGEAIENIALPQLDFESGVEGKGIFVVGNYGTGKSHVMSFLSVLAEDAAMLQYVKNDEWKPRLERFAGKYKVRRCEIGGSMMNLYQIVAEQLQFLAKSCGFTFTFKTQSEISNVKTEFARFMAVFDTVCPGKGVLLIIDEMLHFLQSRPTDNEFILDLSVLQMLGEFSNGSRFVFMAGVQQSLFSNPRFNHVAQDINRVKQRYYDFVIDSKGVAQLIEQYLFQKNAAQKAQIRDLLLKQASLYEVVGPEIEQFVALFPAHPRFIAEFQNVFVVERREILTVLSKEARGLASQEWNEENPALITSDRYWKHIEADQGLNANRDVAQIKQNVTTLKARIQAEFGAAEDKPAAERLVEALAVNRLTTPNITDAVGLKPDDLKNNLLWKTKLPMQDARFLTAAVKRLLDATRKAANGQFIAVSDTTGQYYIDPTRIIDYDQDVADAAQTLTKDAVQRYLNEIVTRAIELDNNAAVQYGRLWEYGLLWTERNVERPGWLCFNYPNQRSTAKPPKDFYLFLIPSRRVTGMEDSMPNNPDETYWFLEDFPPAKCDFKNPLSENEPDSFLDILRKYAAARERAAACQPGNERTAFENIAKKHLSVLLPQFNENAGEWITVQWNGQRKRFREWVTELDPGKANAPFKSKMDVISQAMFAPFFEGKYPDYPTFGVRIQETTRKQATQNALEVLCETGFADNANGKAVLTALGLYKDSAFVPDQSSWLAKVRNRLQPLNVGQFLNQSELFEREDERMWFKGERIEAEWLQVILTAGVKSGDLVIWGTNNKRYDASNLKDFYADIKSYDGIIRISKPSELPYDLWKRLFKLFEQNTGLLANPGTHDAAILQFNTAVQKRINDMVQWEQEIKTPLPFAPVETMAVVAQHAAAFRGAKDGMQTFLQPINTKAKMQNLKLDDGGITALEDQLQMSAGLAGILMFVQENATPLSALERFNTLLGSRDADFRLRLGQLENSLNAVYRDPQGLEAAKDSLKAELTDTVNVALKSYHTLHKRYRLDKAGDGRKKALASGTLLKQLNRLALIQPLGGAKLEDARQPLEKLVFCNGCSDEELVKNAQSQCPRCSFNPNAFSGSETALDVLARCEQDVEQLHTGWTQQLLGELEDPSVLASLNALKPQERTLVDTFTTSRALPTDISDAFINAINTVLSGLKRKSVKPQDFAKQVMGDGTPLKAGEVRDRFEAWLKAQIGTDDQNTVRLVLEE